MVVTTTARAPRGELLAAQQDSRRTLAQAFDPHANSLDVLRLVLAATVAIAHASAIAYGHQPAIGGNEIAGLAVDGFFVLSGFLVARSYLQLNGLGRYAWHRALRIMPGFWVCLLVTAGVVAPLIAALEGRPPLSVFPQAWGYVAQNAGLFMVDFGVADLPTQTSVPLVVNGALWTLFYEAVCYAGVAVLGVLGILRRRPWVVAVGVLLSAAMVTGQASGLVPEVGAFFWRFFLMFGLGTLGLLYADRISVHRRWWLLAGAGLALSLLVGPEYRAVGGGIALAYLCLVAMVATPGLRYRCRVDLSYGVYIYHWPIATLLVLAGGTALTQVGYTLLALALAACAALLSWHFVERPALARKGMAPPAWLRPRRP